MKGIPGEGILPRVIKTHIDTIVRERTADLGISPSCCITLCCIDENEGLSLQELSDLLIVDKSLITRNVKTLIEADLVNNNSRFKNKYSLTLTKRGNDAVKRIRVIVDEVWKEIFSDFTEDEIETFNKLSMKVANKIKMMVNERGECE